MLRWVRAVTVAGIALAAGMLAGLSGRGADASVVGTFDLGLGARSIGMGGAFVGLADDGASLFYNTAGLAWLRGSSLLSTLIAFGIMLSAAGRHETLSSSKVNYNQD